MTTSEWILIDVETTGFAPPNFVVEIAALKMRGWEPFHEPFRKLLNQNKDVPPEASRVHGYTREILERDGESPQTVYAELAAYVEGLPLVSYNLEYDLDQVLIPEWKRLGVPVIGNRGFCALRLAQRLLDPVPAGNCKLQTLRQYYRLPERGAHTALGDVMTVADLMQNVLFPIAERRRINTWAEVLQFTTEQWYPTRIAFGKFKGQSFRKARESKDMRAWLESLARSSNLKGAAMGAWYLDQLEKAGPEADTIQVPAEPIEQGSRVITIYQHPDLDKLRSLVAGARLRLAELEASYTSTKAKVAAVEARLFRALCPHFEERDRLRLVLSYRQAYLNSLLQHGEEEAERVQREYEQADARTESDYRSTAAAMEARHQPSAEEEIELKALWKQLVKLFHPDKFVDDPQKLESYTKLTAAINAAKDNGDLATLRQIANDPTGFMLRQGWAVVEFGDSNELDQLQRLLESLEIEIIATMEAIAALQEGGEYELLQLAESDAGAFEEIVQAQIEATHSEIQTLKTEADRLGKEIEELSGETASAIG